MAGPLPIPWGIVEDEVNAYSTTFLAELPTTLLAELGDRHGVALTLERSATSREHALGVRLRPDTQARSYWISDSAIEDAASVMDVVDQTVADAAVELRGLVISDMLAAGPCRVPERDCALLAEAVLPSFLRATEKLTMSGAQVVAEALVRLLIQHAPEDVIERTAVELMTHVSALR